MSVVQIDLFNDLARIDGFGLHHPNYSSINIPVVRQMIVTLIILVYECCLSVVLI